MRRAFSLTELLVVMGVFAILASWLMPALMRSRALAGQARCLSNLRQMALAARLYWDDNGNRAFPEGVARVSDGHTYWFGWLQDGVEGQRRFDPGAGKLWPYLQGRGVELCPGLNRNSSYFKSKSQGAAFGYGYNLFLGPRDIDNTGRTPPVMIDRLTQPAQVAVFADCGQINDFQAPASPERPMLEEFYFFETTYPTVHFRHGRRAAVAFVDGHVSHETPQPGSEDRRLRGQELGRLASRLVIPE